MSLSGASERSVPATKIEITVSCRNLLDLDTFSKSDPMVVLYTQSRASQEWREFGRTEVIDNTLNPDFVRKFVLDYFFEEKQNLRFDVFIALFEELHSSLSPALKARLALPLGQIQPSSLPTLCSLIWLHLCLHPASDRTLPPAADPRLQLTPHPDSCPREIQVEFRAEAAPPSTHNYNQDLKSDPFSSLSPISPAPRWSHSLPRYNVDSKTNISKPVSDCPLTGWPGTKAALSVLNDLPQNPPTPQTHPPCFPHLFLPQFPFCASFSLLFFLFNCRWDPQKDFLGQAFLALGEVIGGQGSRVERPLTGVPGKKCGTILLTAEELSNCRDIATMQLCANKLDKKDFFGKSDPFLVFYRSNEDGTFTICHKTEVVKNTLNPVWQPFSIPVRALCNGDYDRTVKIDVYDWDRDGSHDFIGEFTTSYRELSKAQNQFTVYEVLNPRKKCKKKKYVNSGTVTLLSFSVDSEFTFVDYIKGGTQLNFTVAIDFTASNGNPLQPTSLHYMSPYQLSAYAMALKAVGEIIQDYDSDKLFPAYGFGAKLPPEGRISHQFPLNNNDEDPNCAGIEGVLESYFQSLRTVQLYGPTYFAPVINQVARAAAKISDGSQYYVLLIITDGVISDMTQTKEAIVSASSLPMSIIIVGVGPAMFEAMEELDGDDVRVSSRGRYAERDIVQFVPFRDYVDRSGNQVLSMARLAKDVLAEIPEQLLSYMRTRDIQPRPPPPANPSPTPAPEQP
uniref:Copine family member 9 n=1 Tax=Sus scrofa TaxID=9823 RepID=A0A8D1EN88_PIG